MDTSYFDDTANILDRFIFEQKEKDLISETDGAVVLNEGISSFLKGLEKTNPRKAMADINLKYKKMNSRVEKEGKVLAKHGISMFKMERAAEKEAKRLKPKFIKLVQENTSNEERQSIVLEIVKIIKAAILATIANRIDKITQIDPPQLLTPLVFVITFLTVKFITLYLVEIILLYMFGVSPGAVMKVLLAVTKIFLVIGFSTIIDMIARNAVIDRGVSKYYAIIKHTIDAPFFLYYMTQVTGSLAMSVFIKIVSYIFERKGIALLADSKKYGTFTSVNKWVTVFDVLKRFITTLYYRGNWEIMASAVSSF